MNDPYTLVEVFKLEDFKHQIIYALDAIGSKSGGRYPSEFVFEHLKKRVIESADNSAVWLFLDAPLVDGKVQPDSIVGFMTMDIWQDEVAEPFALVSRAWCKPGLGKELWAIGRDAVVDWAKRHGCKGVSFQTERDTAFARWLQQDGFKKLETIFEKRFEEVAV